MKNNVMNFIDNQYIIGIILSLVILISLIFLLFITVKNKRKNTESRVIEELKKEYSPEKTLIPLNIFQTWHTKNIPPDMAKCIKKLKKDNPEFEHYLFDFEDCREFIKQYFSNDVVYAFDTLVPFAYKADLWRLCVLYIHGGIYMDVKLQCVRDFKLKYLTMDEHYVKDKNYNYIYYFGYYYGIYNAFMVCKAGNPFLMKCIRLIVNNVNNKIYGVSPLYPTGPMLLGEEYRKNKWRLNTDMKLTEFNNILYRKISILTHYKTYRIEQKKHANVKRYPELWVKRKIYNN
jgi:mannosyltransferase OCH1-like enzyme